MACVDVPALPLQLVLRHHPEWKERPTAVIDCDKPQGQILCVNEQARASCILPGMRYAAALSLSRDLRAAEVPSSVMESAIESIVARLRDFTPAVEPAFEDPGIFWLDASGLGRLYVSLREWARLIRLALKRSEFVDSAVVVGFTKFGTLAIARASHGITVLSERAEEDAAARRVPLERLPLDPAAIDTLYKLGVRTVDDFAALPPEGLERRFGEEARRLHRQARGELRVPLEPQLPEEPVWRRIHLDHAETDVSRLMALVGRMMRPLLDILEGRGQGLSEIRLELFFENGGRRMERVRPAAPTTDPPQLGELVRLRLESKRLTDRVTGLALTVEGSRAECAQLELFAATPPRDLGAANRALARIRAEFGEPAVVRAKLREAHLPEALYFWEPLGKLREADPFQVESGALVRRIYSHPIPLPARPRHEPDGWMLRGLAQGPVVRVLGPFIVSGGWWQRLVHREYHFAETQKGELLWVYYDRFRRRWFIQGRLE